MSLRIVQQKLTISPNHSAQTLLSALQPCSGLIWLADDTQPVIGLCPRWQISQSRHTPPSTAPTVVIERRWRQADGQLSAPVTVPLDFEQAIRHDWVDSQIDHWQLPELSGFRGGLMGFIGYDWAAAQHGIALAPTDQPTPASQAVLGCYDIFLRKDAKGWHLYGADCARLQTVYQHIQNIAHGLLTPRDPLPDLQMIQNFMPRWSPLQYQQAFAQVQAYLRAGDCYQVNLTQAFDATISGDLLSRLDDLNRLTHAPYAGYLAISAEHELLSCSPELFLAFLPDGEVVTRPIKGTQPRDADPRQDAARKQQLALSEKDQAENLMIVDLLRNDLARQAKIGSVHVPKLFEIESFAQVHHLVSEIRATLAEDQSALDLLYDALPGGSITGAPKLRAMQIIAELEAGQRGAYCGSMGYLNADGTGRFNILIRTLERVGAQVSVWAGGGITIASDVTQEYQECWDKVGAILGCLEG